MAAAVATLPWVEPDSIFADRKTRQVRFAVTDIAAFDEDAVKDVIRRAGYRGARRLVGPTAPPKEPPP
ncbi:MAG: hypothetical protein K2X82_01745 [Gemmataceae bacterium]|nr:hypothetical protein [Gemmataceae bacterium]